VEAWPTKLSLRARKFPDQPMADVEVRCSLTCPGDLVKLVFSAAVENCLCGFVLLRLMDVPDPSADKHCL
jgi:hypothetical protein